MRKKQKKNLQQRINKRQQLQQIGQAISPNAETLTSGTISLPAAPTPLALPADTHLIKEVRRTLLSFLLIAVILVVVVVIDRRSPYLLNFGDRLFNFLRLN